MSRYIYDPNLDSERVRIASLQGSTDPDTIFTLEQVGIQSGWRCLEIGAGGGSIAKWLAAKVGANGSVVATDLNTIFLDELDVPNIEVRQHDIVNDDLETEAFDLVHSRFLLEHLPERDEVLDKMIAAVKPGGWVAMEDVDFGSALWADPDQLMVHPPKQAEIGRIGLAQMKDAFIENGVLSSEDFDLADRSLADPSMLSSSPMLVAAWGRRP